VIVELGAGTKPTPYADIYHDRTRHSDHINISHDLEVFPWPWADDSIEQLVAIDVFEHLRVDPWWAWLDECWRVLKPSGKLTMRLPAWDNPVTYRDPTHVPTCWPFHIQRFDYWDPCRPLWSEFGRIYPFAETARWWHVDLAVRDVETVDLKFYLTKVGEGHGADVVADGERPS
jgi:hypothetical protein